MRGFALLVAVTLAAIGSGVGIEAAGAPEQTWKVTIQAPSLSPPSGMGEVRVELQNVKTGYIQFGPPLATFDWDSGSHPEVVRSSDALWVFELETPNGPTVWRISPTTGAVEQMARVPALSRPFLAADASGLYLAGDGSFGGLPNGDLIFYLADGATTAKLVLATPRNDAGIAVVDAFTFGGNGVTAEVCLRPTWSCQSRLVPGSARSATRRTVASSGIQEEVPTPQPADQANRTP